MIPGINKLVLNNLTIRAAVEEYLNKRLDGEYVQVTFADQDELTVEFSTTSNGLPPPPKP